MEVVVPKRDTGALGDDEESTVNAYPRAGVKPAHAWPECSPHQWERVPMHLHMARSSGRGGGDLQETVNMC